MDRLQKIKEQYTPENMDKLLAYLLKNAKIEVCYTGIDGASIVNELGIELEFINCFLKEFNEMGLIDFKGFNHGNTIDLIVLKNAAAFYTRSGFVLQDEIYIKNLNLLEAQLQELQPKIPIEQFEKISSILSNVMTISTALFGSKM